MYANMTSIEINDMDQSPPLTVNVTENERKLLESAAELTHSSVGDFIRRKALEAAELELMDRRVITIPAEKWEEFEAWAKSPPKDVPGLRRLATMRLAWED
jgi:uncharacterized protein (DUF1778 family)